MQQGLVVLNQIHEAGMAGQPHGVLGLLRRPPRGGHEHVPLANRQWLGPVVAADKLERRRDLAAEQPTEVRPERGGVLVEGRVGGNQSHPHAVQGQPAGDLQRGIGPARQVTHRQTGHQHVQARRRGESRRHRQVQRIEPRQAASRRDVCGRRRLRCGRQAFVPPTLQIVHQRVEAVGPQVGMRREYDAASKCRCGSRPSSAPLWT